MAMRPPAPGRFSMMTVWPHISDSRLATMRPAESMPPPGGKPTSSFTIRDGQVSARARRAKGNNATAPVSRKNCRREDFTILLFVSGQTRDSLYLDVGGLDNRPPFLGFGFLERSKRLRSLFLPRGDLLAKLVQPLLYIRIRQCRDGGGIDLGDDVLRRVPRRPHAEPDGRIVSRQAGLVRCRHIRQTGKTRLGRNGDRPDGAGLNLRREIGRWLDHHIDLAGHQVLHRRAVAAIGYELERGSRHFLK